MKGFILGNPGSFAALIGFMFFMFMASSFNHDRIGEVRDRGVVFLCMVVAALCGLVVGLFVKIVVTLFI